MVKRYRSRDGIDREAAGVEASLIGLGQRGMGMLPETVQVIVVWRRRRKAKTKGALGVHGKGRQRRLDGLGDDVIIYGRVLRFNT